MRRILSRVGLWLLLACTTVLPWAALSDSAPLPGPYQARVLAVYDGDTFTARIEVWPDVTVTPSIRLEGVDTPELRGQCAAEQRQAQLAKAFTVEQLARGSVLLWDVAHDKYAGRVVARVTVQGEDLATLLIAAHLGRPYGGETRGAWCR